MRSRSPPCFAVPVRRAGRTLGVVAVQNRNPRRYADGRSGGTGNRGDAAGRGAGGKRRLRRVAGRRRRHGAAGVRRHHAGRRHRHRPGGAAWQPSAPVPSAGRRPGSGAGAAARRGAPDAAGPRRADRRRAGRICVRRGRIGLARGARCLSPGGRRCRLAEARLRGDPRRAVSRGRGAAGRRRAA